MRRGQQTDADAALSVSAVTRLFLPYRVTDARNVLRAALTCAVEEQIITRTRRRCPGCLSVADQGASTGPGPSMKPAGS